MGLCKEGYGTQLNTPIRICTTTGGGGVNSFHFQLQTLFMFNINVSNLDGLLQTRNLKETSGGTIAEKLTKAAQRSPELAAFLAANVGKTIKITLDEAVGFTDEAYGREVTLVATATNVKIGSFGISSMRLPFFIGGLAMRQTVEGSANANVVSVVVTTGEYETRASETKTWYSFAMPNGTAMTIKELETILKQVKASKLDTFKID